MGFQSITIAVTDFKVEDLMFALTFDKDLIVKGVIAPSCEEEEYQLIGIYNHDVAEVVDQNYITHDFNTIIVWEDERISAKVHLKIMDTSRNGSIAFKLYPPDNYSE